MMITVQRTKISAEMIQFPFLQFFAKKSLFYERDHKKYS